LSEKPVKHLKISGYDLEKLETEHGMNRIAAFLTLDWIKKSPDIAIKALKRGHDLVKFS
jgi:hypothetical protein